MKPTFKAIKDCFPNSDPKLVMKLLRDPNAVETYISEHSLASTPNNPRLARLTALNHALNMFGVEHAGQFGEKGFAYLNTGDPYYVTLRQFDDCKQISIGTIASIIERGGYK